MMGHESLRLNLIFGEKRGGGEARHKGGSLEVRKGGEGQYKKKEKKTFLRGRIKKEGKKKKVLNLKVHFLKKKGGCSYIHKNLNQ